MKATDLLLIGGGAIVALVAYRYFVGRQAAGTGDPLHYNGSPVDPYQAALNDPPPAGAPAVPPVYDDTPFVDPATVPSSPLLSWQTTYRLPYRIAT